MQQQQPEKNTIEPLLKGPSTSQITHKPDTEDNEPSTYRQLFFFADQIDWVLMAIAVIFSLGNGVSIVFYAFPLKQLINAFSETSSQQEIVAATLQSVYGFLINSAVVFVNCWFMTAAWTITSERQMNRARKQYFKALLRQEIEWHDKRRPAQICSKMYIQVQKVQQGIVTNMTAVLNKVSMGAAGIVLALVIGYQMALVMIAFLPVMMLSGMVRGHYTKQKDMYLQTDKVKLDSDVIEVFDNIKAVKMLGGQDYETTRYQKQLGKQFQANWAHGWKGAVAFTFFFFCIICNYALGFWYGARLVASRTINHNTGSPYDVAEVITIFFTLYISNLNLSGLPDCMASFSVSRYSMGRILGIVNRVPRMQDGHITLSKDRVIEEVGFRNVEFAYSAPLFQDLNLVLRRGVTALMGESGCGKSTILALLMRFYDVKKGEVYLRAGMAEIKLENIKIDSLRSVIGYVGQEPILIGKTIREVLMAEDCPNEKIYQVLKLVKSDDFVRSIGLHAEFRSVSGGQKQRLAIARALLKNPMVLILDESTSALDHSTQQELLARIRGAGVEFIVMVSHRHETLKFADRIVKINKDQIQYEGTYEQLVAEGLIQASGQRDQPIGAHMDQEQLETEENTMKIQTQQKQEDAQANQAEVQQKHSNLPFQWDYISKLMHLSQDKWYLYIAGTVGAAYFGCIFPMFSYLISKIIVILQKISTAEGEELAHYQEQAYLMSTSLFVISLGSLLFTTLRWVCFEYLNERIGYKVKNRAFKELVSRPYATIQEDQPQTYAYMIVKNCQDLKPLAGNFMPSIIENMITLVAGLAIGFAYCWQIIVVSLFILPLILLSSKMMMSFNHGMQSNTDEIHKRNHQLVITSIMHLRTVRSCQLQGSITSKYEKELDEALNFTVKHGNIAGVLFGIGQTLISCTFAVIFLIGSFLIKSGSISVSDMYTSIFAVMFAGVQAGGNLYFLSQISAAKIGACVYFQKINRPSQADLELIDECSQADGTDGEGASVVIEDLTFTYKTREKPLFKNFSMRVNKNEKVAIVGESGSGKSTLASLLFQLYKPDRGRIKINQQQLPARRACKLLGIVMQEPVLFNRSICQNIRYNSKASFEQIKDSCKQVNAYDFIVNSGLGNVENQAVDLILAGFQKSAGPRGSYLSGGQKQRIAIVRALVRKPKIIVLDEATSALDTQNELIVQEAMQKMGKTTQIIIAHRLSTIVKCNRILVLSQGQIVEQGTYESLLKKKGHFSKLMTNKYQ